MVFTSPKCTAHCLHTCVGEMTDGQSLDLPPEITDYNDVFGEKEADRLLPHCPYDCPIDLV